MYVLQYVQATPESDCTSIYDLSNSRLRLETLIALCPVSSLLFLHTSLDMNNHFERLLSTSQKKMFLLS